MKKVAILTFIIVAIISFMLYNYIENVRTGLFFETQNKVLNTVNGTIPVTTKAIENIKTSFDILQFGLVVLGIISVGIFVLVLILKFRF